MAVVEGRGLEKVAAARAAELLGHVRCERCGLGRIALILQAAAELIQTLKVYQGNIHGCFPASVRP